jgi:hypothetical protein
MISSMYTSVRLCVMALLLHCRRILSSSSSILLSHRVLARASSVRCAQSCIVVMFVTCSAAPRPPKTAPLRASYLGTQCAFALSALRFHLQVTPHGRFMVMAMRAGLLLASASALNPAPKTPRRRLHRVRAGPPRAWPLSPEFPSAPAPLQRPSPPSSCHPSGPKMNSESVAPICASPHSLHHPLPIVAADHAPRSSTDFWCEQECKDDCRTLS